MRTKVDFGMKPLGTRDMQAIMEKFSLSEMLWNSKSIYYTLAYELLVRLEAWFYNGEHG
jgi:hypothetical protein